MNRIADSRANVAASFCRTFILINGITTKLYGGVPCAVYVHDVRATERDTKTKNCQERKREGSVRGAGSGHSGLVGRLPSASAVSSE